MSERPYEYGGMLASCWDLLRGNTSSWPDRAFYREVISRFGDPALDVGCGTGRLLLDYLAEGIDIEGVDNSPEMIALCNEKARALGLTPAVYEQTMQTLDLPRRYRTIIVPSSSFLLLTDEADAASAMERFLAHLEPGGVLAMPFMTLVRGRPKDGEWTPWYKTGEQQRTEDGATVRRWQRARFHFAAQLEDTQDRYEVIAGGEVAATEEHHREPATRWYTQEESLPLYERAGFTEVHATSGFTFERASGELPIWMVFGTRPR